ncbi:MAG TPA: leucine--tRNA ligase [Fimbriimonadaceae bacterium]|nr:leucine--tRNA ligase [Fimbriimonadaceae bacterium]
MPDRYEPATFEAKWRARWQEAELFRTREDDGRPKFYGLDFFPFPSGAGLSVGHCRNYVPTDVICRFKMMQGYNVLHPMGFDAFGLPAENEAIKNKVHPGPMIDRYAANYRRQMDLVGISYDWSRAVNSSHPDYYRWTQSIFKLLYERGLAYRRLADVNWCPKDKTALANEEVVAGRCERCGTLVEKKAIPQWYFKITDYAQRLIDGLDTIDWPEGIKALQRNWIGRSEGVEFSMKVVFDGETSSGPDENGFEVLSGDRTPMLRVFTTRIDTVFGVTFAVIAPEHPLMDLILSRVEQAQAEAVREYVKVAATMSDIDRQAESREKTGVFSGAYAINPLNGAKVPIWVADYVLATYGTGAIMAVPGHDGRDFEFAKKFGIEIPQVIAPSDESSVDLPFEAKDGILVNSGEYSGMPVAEAQDSLGKWIEANGIGERKVQYRLRDWLISRQRYWGCPIPIIHTADGEMQTVPDDALPVYLPDVENYAPTGDGSSPLAAIPDFVNTTDRDGRLGRRETDTMGGFACSSWYFLRFCDPHNDAKAFDFDRVKYWMPVDCYVGGAEHAVLHLLYARFWTKVLYDAGLCPVDEPFQKLHNQGQVLAKTPYRKPREGEKLELGEDGILVSFAEAADLPEDDLIWRWARMSKSKGNVVTPDEAVEQFGADALRIYELFVAPFEQDVQWDNAGMQGAVRFLGKIFRLVDEWRAHYDNSWKTHIGTTEPDETSKAIRRATHQAIAKATDDIERFAFNTYISAMMIYVNKLTDIKSIETRAQKLAASEAIENLILLIAPAAPHSADELWESVGNIGFTYLADWPAFDAALSAEDEVTIAVQVNGKLRDTLMVPAGLDNSALEVHAMASEKVQGHLAGLTIRKVIVVPGKLVNIVASA